MIRVIENLKNKPISRLYVVFFLALFLGIFTSSLEFINKSFLFLSHYTQLPIPDILSDAIYLLVCILFFLTYNRLKKAIKGQKKMENIIESISSDVILVTDSDDRIVKSNSTVERMFGYGINEVMHKKVDIFFDRTSSHSKDQDKRQHFIAQSGVDFGKKKSGEIFPVEIIKEELLEQGGSVLLLRDITDRKKAEESLLKYKNELESRVADRTSELNQLTIDLKNKLDHIKLLHSFGLKIVSISDTEKLVSFVVRQTINLLGYHNVTVFLVQGDHLVLKASSFCSKKLNELQIPVHQAIVGKCIKNREIINITNISQCDFPPITVIEGVQSMMAAPIFFEMQLLGLITIESTEPNFFKEEDEMLLRILSCQLGVALRNADILKEIRKVAITDSLTDLYNYRYFCDSLNEEILRARRYNRDLSLILLDLDNFKKVNDIFGHLKGNEVLTTVSELMKKNIRQMDTPAIMKDEESKIARYGGDEFMIILPETPLKGAIVVAKRLQGIINEEINKILPKSKKSHRKNLLSVSFGVVCLKPGEEADHFIHRVDKAMYKAKQKSKDLVCTRD